MFGYSEMSGNLPLMLYLLFKDKVNRKNKHGSKWPYLSESVSDEYVMKQAMRRVSKCHYRKKNMRK